MFENLHWLIILVIFGLLIFYSNSNQYINDNINENQNTFQEYKFVQPVVNNDMNLEERRKKDVKVDYPFSLNNNDNNNDYEFGLHSIYEVGRININPSY